MKKFNFLIFILLMALSLGMAAQNSCQDLNGYVNSKNIGPTGYYTLRTDFEEKLAQTYRYSGPGIINSVMLRGQIPNTPEAFYRIRLKVGIYHVDVNNRPTTLIASQYITFYAWESAVVVNLPVGVSVSTNFAVSVEIDNPNIAYSRIFQIEYTGDGDGKLENLTSISGTSTGFNWVSALTNFSKDGDFHIIPNMQHFINSEFTTSSGCVSTSANISFTNTTQMSRDSMFNTIGLSSYSGSNEFFTWNFGDGSPVSHMTNPTHSYTVPGVYTVKLTSTLEGWNNTCSDVDSMKISVGLDVNATNIVHVTCNGGNDGLVVASASGGAPPYLYSINGLTFQSATTFNSRTAGTHTLYVLDALQCMDNTSFIINQPPAITFTSIGTTSASCGNPTGAILINATGGVAPVQYSIDGINYQSSGSFTGLLAKTYTVRVRDASNCIATKLVSVNNITGPELSLFSATNISCNGGNDGSILVLGSGGSGTLQYSVDGINFQTNGTFNNLPAASYGVTVKDAAGCIDGFAITLTEPLEINFTVSGIPATCNGASNGL